MPCNTTIRNLETPEPESSGKGRPAGRPPQRVDRWTQDQQTQADDAHNTQDAWTAINLRDGEKGPLTVDVLKRRVETGKRGRPTVTEDVLVEVRDKDRDNRIVKTDYSLSNADAAVDVGKQTSVLPGCVGT